MELKKGDEIGGSVVADANEIDVWLWCDCSTRYKESRAAVVEAHKKGTALHCPGCAPRPDHVTPPPPVPAEVHIPPPIVVQSPPAPEKKHAPSVHIKPPRCSRKHVPQSPEAIRGVALIRAGWPIGKIAAELEVAFQTVAKWKLRWVDVPRLEELEKENAELKEQLRKLRAKK